MKRRQSGPPGSSRKNHIVPDPARKMKFKSSDKPNNPKKPKKRPKSKVVEYKDADRKRLEKRFEKAAGTEAVRSVRMTRKKLKQLRKLRGEFKHDVPDIYAMLEQGATARQIQRAFYNAALASCIALIPILESKTVGSEWDRDVYALNAAIAQGMDILGQLRALDDQQQQAFDLIDQVVNPLYDAVAHQIVNCLSILRDNINPYIDAKNEMHVRELFQVSARELGSYLDVSKETTRNNVLRHMG